MEKKNKKRYNILIGLLSVMVCAFIVIGVVLGMGAGSTAPVMPEDAALLTVAAPSESAAVENAVTGDIGDGAPDAMQINFVESLSDPVDIPDDGFGDSAAAEVPDDTAVLAATSRILITPLAAEPEISFSSSNPYRYNYVNAGGWIAVTTGDTVNKFDFTRENLFFQFQFSGVTALNQDSFYDGFINMTEDGGSFTNFTIVPESGNLGRLILQIAMTDLSDDSEYAIVIDGAIASGGESNVVIKFAAQDAPPPTPSQFDAVFVYPYSVNNSFRNMPVDSSITVVFTERVWQQTVSAAGNVVLREQGGADVPASITLENSERKILTITPTDTLAYGATYELVLASAITSDDRISTLGADKTLSFTTQSYEITGVSATINSDRTEITSLNIAYSRLGGGPGTPTIMAEIRRDIGARLEDGGTVVYIGDGASQSSIDISRAFNSTEAVNGDIYIDVFILDNNGRQIGDVFHMQLG